MTAARLPPVPVDADRARETADRVLARPAFREHEGGLVQQAQEWILEQISEVVDRLAAGDQASLLGWAVLGAITVAASVVMVRFARGVVPDRLIDAGSPGAGRRPAADWFAEADRLLETGDRRGALRCRYRGVLAHLAERAVIEEVPGRTAREYAAHIGRAVPAAAGPAREATALFERVWYGGAPADEPVMRRFGELADRVMGAAR